MLAIVLLVMHLPVQACDKAYFSPLALSHHWGEGDWNEVHPGITVECHKGVFGVAAGRMRNSINRNVRFLSATISWPVSKMISVRAGGAVGDYEGWRDTLPFVSPVVALTLGEGYRIALDVMHIPSGGSFSPVPVTIAAVRIRIW